MLVGLAGAWLGVVAWDGVRGDLDLVTVQASFKPALAGGTEVDLPPFGSLFALTHQGPLRLRLQVDQLHVEETIEWLKQRKTPEEAVAHLHEEIRHVSGKLVKGTVLVALIGAAAATMLLGSGWRYTLVGVVAGVLGVAVPLGIAVHTYDTAAFSSPRYEGELSRAPRLLDAIHQGYTNAVERLPVITDQVVELYQQLETNGAGAAVDRKAKLRVLLISDLHNNPLGLNFALDLARSYRVRMVLVCGDVTDFGHSLEGELLTGWERFSVPVAMVTGNHDSRSVADALSAISGVTVLDNGEAVETAGLRVAGYGDPAARRPGPGSVNASAKDLDNLAQRMTRDLAKRDTPDVLMVHNFRVARNLVGRTPLIVTGHSHSALVEERKGTVIVNPGTTGAAGVRYFTSKQSPPYTAAVLHFARDGAKPRLSMVDLVELQQPSGDFVISRRSIATPEIPAPQQQ